jgi:hypothetical protein
MTAKSKIALTIIVACLVIGGIALVLLKIESPKSSGESTSDTTALTTDTTMPTSSPTASATAGDWHSYQNTDYGFALTFGSAWQGYQVVKDVNNPMGVTASYAFSLKTTDQSQGPLATPLTIYVYKQADFDAIDNSALPGTKVGSSKGYVFTYKTWNEAPSDLGGLTDKAIADVIKTFKIL